MVITKEMSFVNTFLWFPLIIGIVEFELLATIFFFIIQYQLSLILTF